MTNNNSTPTYEDSIKAASALVQDGCDSEYIRGIIELIAELYPDQDGLDVGQQARKAFNDIATKIALRHRHDLIT